MSPQQSIAHYRITAKLGEGGMGEVWRATDAKLGRDVALKILPAGFASDPTRMARFEREAKALASLNHPHIAQTYGVEESVMDLVEGEPLKGPMPVEKAGEYSGQILDALDAAHKKGIMHRDLKPANILVTRQGIKLLDFGLAKLTERPITESDETVAQGLTQQGQIVGTLQYMAPEQLNGREVDSRSDLFSFGCSLPWPSRRWSDHCCHDENSSGSSELASQDGATIRFAVTRVTLRRDESSGAEPHTKGNGRSCLRYDLSDWMSMPTRLQLQ